MKEKVNLIRIRNRIQKPDRKLLTKRKQNRKVSFRQKQGRRFPSKRRQRQNRRRRSISMNYRRRNQNSKQRNIPMTAITTTAATGTRVGTSRETSVSLR